MLLFFTGFHILLKFKNAKTGKICNFIKNFYFYGILLTPQLAKMFLQYSLFLKYNPKTSYYRILLFCINILILRYISGTQTAGKFLLFYRIFTLFLKYSKNPVKLQKRIKNLQEKQAKTYFSVYFWHPNC